MDRCTYVMIYSSVYAKAVPCMYAFLWTDGYIELCLYRYVNMFLCVFIHLFS